jgi:hypothetical protein
MPEIMRSPIFPISSNQRLSNLRRRPNSSSHFQRLKRPAALTSVTKRPTEEGRTIHVLALYVDSETSRTMYPSGPGSPGGGDEPCDVEHYR